MKSSGRVAILGRPNVGKSSLFNVLTRSRRALVKNQPGVTRDVLEENCDWWGGSFTLLDTGGITDTDEGFAREIKALVERTIKTVDLLILIFDGKAGVLPEDHDIVRLAKQSGKPFYAIVNKVDKYERGQEILLEFSELGIDLSCASFEQREGLAPMIEWILENLPKRDRQDRNGIRLTVLGKPNVGKSSLCNRLLGMDRQIVSALPGTTTDAVELEFEFEGESFVLVDTAGLRRAAKRNKGLEGLAALKSEQALDRSEIALLVVDAIEGPTEQDAKLLQAIYEHATPAVLVLNKIDLVEDKRSFKELLKQKLDFQFHFLDDLPTVFVSAETGAGIPNLLKTVKRIWRKMHVKVPTSKLNKFFQTSIRSAPAPVWGSANVKFYYLTQTKQVPPAFIAFANHPEGVTAGYRRFLTKRLKIEFHMEGVPVRIFCMKSGRDLEKLPEHAL